MRVEEKHRKNRDFYEAIYKDFDIDAFNSLNDIEAFHSFFEPAAEFFYREQYFAELLKKIRDKKILSLGGGVDKAAVYLAAHRNDVTSADISSEAAHHTVSLARKLHITENIRAVTLNLEKDALPGMYDVVIAHDVLHHLEVPAAISKICSCLRPQGYLLAMEPICLPGFLRGIHRRFPLYPDCFLPEIERELSRKDLENICAAFRKIQVYYFGLFSRESVIGYLYKQGLKKPLRQIGKIDYMVMKALPFLKQFGSYVIVKAEK